MPDPARPIVLILSAFVLSFLMCVFLSASLRLESERVRRAKSGFSDRNIGALLFIIAAGGLFCYASFQLGVSVFAEGALILAYLAFGLLFPFTLGYLYSAFFNKYLYPVFGFLAKIVGVSVGLLISLPSYLLVTLGKGTTPPDFTEEDVLSIVDTAEEQDFIDENQKEMITNIFELDDITAGDAMTHRTDIVAIEENTPIIEAIRLSMEEGVSRLPVYRKTLDDVLGMVYVKDLFVLLDDVAGREKMAGEFVRGVMYTPEAAKARELLTEFKKKHTQIAIVVDEYGGTSGLVTMEDILEEIVGDMQDEFDDEDDLIHEISDGVYLCDATVDIEDIFDIFSLPVPEEFEEEDFESIGGLIIEKLGRIPENGEHPEIRYGGVLFRVQETGERRILKVLCTQETEETAIHETL